MFPFEFREIFKYTFFKEHLRATFSGFCQFVCYISSKIVAGINKIISGIWLSKVSTLQSNKANHVVETETSVN